MNIAFAGTPEFAAIALRAIHSAGHTISLVLCQPDRPSGRGLLMHASAVKTLALELGLTVLQPAGLRLDGRHAHEATATRMALEGAAPEVMVVAAYGLILPQWVLDRPRHGCLNIHASLLPRWRGAAPIQRAIEAGDASTGITIMQMDAGLDTGDMLLAEPLAITGEETSARLHARLAELGARLIVRALSGLSQGRLHATRQAAADSTYAAKITKAEAAIDWRQSAHVIERRVRAFDPFPGATFSFTGETLKLWRARVHACSRGSCGEVLSTLPGPLVVACGDGALELLELQRPGGRRRPAEQCFPAGAPRLGDHFDAVAG